LLLPDARGRALWRTPALAALVVIPVLGAYALHGVYNAERFGDWLATGYSTGFGGPLDFGGNPLIGAYGLLLSPGRGILWFAPPVLAAVLAWRHLRGRSHDVRAAFTTMVMVWFAVHCFWKDWDAGWGWGPRYLMPVLPLVLVPLAAAWAAPRSRFIIACLVGIGLLIQVPGATVDFMEAGSAGGAEFRVFCPDCTHEQFAEWRNFDPHGSELRWHAILYLAGRRDVAWQTFTAVPVAQLTILVAILLALAGLLMLRNAGRGDAGLDRFRGAGRALGPARSPSGAARWRWPWAQ
jgi:hypothetical protein